MTPSTVTVLNTPCLVTDPKDLTEKITELVRRDSDKPYSIDFTNVHIVAMRKTEEEFRSHTSEVDWYVPDSQILTWAVSWLGGKGNERVYGPAFLDYFVRNADPTLTHYFLGGSQECLDQLLIKLKEKRPDLNVAGSHHGYFGPESDDDIIQDINASGADLVWVGLGTPKQQEWINQYKAEVKASALLAVGFAFDVNAETKKDAPAWMGKFGVLWLYRFCCEPRRLFKRYAVYNSIFIWHLLRQVMS